MTEKWAHALGQLDWLIKSGHRLGQIVSPVIAVVLCRRQELGKYGGRMNHVSGVSHSYPAASCTLHCSNWRITLDVDVRVKDALEPHWRPWLQDSPLQGRDLFE